MSGFSSSAWYAISIAFSTPKQKPKCLAILKQTGPKFNLEGERSRLRGSVMRRACLIKEIIGLRKKCGTSNVRDKLGLPRCGIVGGGYALSTFRPFARRWDNILRPCRSDIRLRKPNLLLRFRRLGWYVLFTEFTPFRI